jgi:predicted pyridoxine 5'-phosphate oxidase superfamily flavin-nucleotide-binding protein
MKIFGAALNLVSLLALVSAFSLSQDAIGEPDTTPVPEPTQGLRGTLPVPVIQEPTLQQLDTSKGQNWRRATMNISGSMCPACLLELEGNLRHQLGVTFSHIKREPASPTQSNKATHNIASAVVIYDLRFIDLNQLERCIKSDKYKASEIAESAQW